MSPSRKSDQPRRSRGSHATRRHAAARAAAAQPPRPPPLAWLARVALRDEERAA